MLYRSEDARQHPLAKRGRLPYTVRAKTQFQPSPHHAGKGGAAAQHSTDDGPWKRLAVPGRAREAATVDATQNAVRTEHDNDSDRGCGRGFLMATPSVSQNSATGQGNPLRISCLL